MSITIAPAGHARYKDQLKLMRAATVSSWMVAALDWIAKPLRVEPILEQDIDKPAPQRYFGAFHC